MKIWCWWGEGRECRCSVGRVEGNTVIGGGGVRQHDGSYNGQCPSCCESNGGVSSADGVDSASRLFCRRCSDCLSLFNCRFVLVRLAFRFRFWDDGGCS